MIRARRQRWCRSCRRRTWHRVRVDLKTLPKYQWLDSVAIACERCQRGAVWHSMGVGEKTR